jgi:hypothetical protein
LIWNRCQIRESFFRLFRKFIIATGEKAANSIGGTFPYVCYGGACAKGETKNERSQPGPTHGTILLYNHGNLIFGTVH